MFVMMFTQGNITKIKITVKKSYPNSVPRSQSFTVYSNMGLDDTSQNRWSRTKVFSDLVLGSGSHCTHSKNCVSSHYLSLIA